LSISIGAPRRMSIAFSRGKSPVIFRSSKPPNSKISAETRGARLPDIRRQAVRRLRCADDADKARVTVPGALGHFLDIPHMTKFRRKMVRPITRSDTCTRLGVLPKSGIRTSIISAESFADLQAGHDCLWQVPSSNEKQGQRDNQNDVDDRRFQQLLFRVCPIEFEG
jgi:hypothetical protein